MSITLFIGNGINYADKVAISWGNLLASICSEDTESISETLGMTLRYEYIDAVSPSKSVEIKRDVAKKTAEKSKDITNKKNSFHERIMKLPVETVITTNYDYSLELSVDAQFTPTQNTKEKLYSFYRKQMVDETTVYHIHGECRYPYSICLGFEHYAGMLEKMRNKIVARTAEKDTNKRFHLFDVISGLSKSDGAWYYNFFTNNIYFLGFGFDPSEEDIWWLITYRRSIQEQYPDLVKNKLILLDVATSKEKKKPKEKDIRRVLKAMGVEIMNLDGRTHREKYKSAMAILEQKAKKDV